MTAVVQDDDDDDEEEEEDEAFPVYGTMWHLCIPN